jgi:hypothetical protein
MIQTFWMILNDNFINFSLRFNKECMFLKKKKKKVEWK